MPSKKSVAIEVNDVPFPPPPPEVVKCKMCNRKIISWRADNTSNYDWKDRQFHRTCYYKKIMKTSWT